MKNRHFAILAAAFAATVLASGARSAGHLARGAQAVSAQTIAPGSAGPAGQPATGTQVIVLGNGTPVVNAERSGTSVGVLVNGTIYIFDAGPGVERRVFEAREWHHVVIQHYGPVFISHLHSDHTLGLPAMLYYAREPNRPFSVIGPPGIKNMMDHILAAYAEDRNMRVNGLEHASPVRWETNVKEVTGGVVFQDPNVKVQAFEVTHGSWAHALGYRIDTADRSIVISGDTSAKAGDTIAKVCNGCDLLFHEITIQTGPIRSAADAAGVGGNSQRGGMDPRYMEEFHTSPAELASIVSRAKPKVLVLYHCVGFATPAEFVESVAANYHDGPVIYANDLAVF